jgi:thioredoxin reductase
VIPRGAVFVRPANVPHGDGVLTRLGCAVDAAGFVTVDGTVRTSAFGVWAAGNVVDPRAQVITSAGAGSAAAVAIDADLMQEDVERVVDRLAAAGVFSAAAESAVTRTVLGVRRHGL